jgi:hypothetical protein
MSGEYLTSQGPLALLTISTNNIAVVVGDGLTILGLPNCAVEIYKRINSNSQWLLSNTLFSGTSRLTNISSMDSSINSLSFYDVNTGIVTSAMLNSVTQQFQKSDILIYNPTGSDQFGLSMYVTDDSSIVILDTDVARVYSLITGNEILKLELSESLLSANLTTNVRARPFSQSTLCVPNTDDETLPYIQFILNVFYMTNPPVFGTYAQRFRIDLDKIMVQ